MKLHEYLQTPGAMTVSELRERIGVKSDAQVRQWQHGYGGRAPSPENCVAIEIATDGKVSRRDLRPRDWHRIWPELGAATAAVVDGLLGTVRRDDRSAGERRTHEDRRGAGVDGPDAQAGELSPVAMGVERRSECERRSVERGGR